MATVQSHRDDIDGLRAIAVVPVLLFHADIKGFSGGFVGVDVFFVISGFLITGIIYRELDRGTFTLAKFYERRIRRIFPALFVLLGAVFGAGYLALVPPDLAQLGKSIVATALFASNIFFFRQSGYFDMAAETKPLLHTWSLAVEEQYYVLFPLCLWLVYRWRREWVVPAIIGAALVSFGASWITVVKSQTAAFFLPQSRAWELLLGSALFFAPQFRSSMLSFGGLIMICVAVFMFDEATPFPGPAALLPCLGAAAIIAGGAGTPVGRLLSVPAFTFVGKISYSLYLWHWPILVFARFVFGDPLSPYESAVCLLIAFIVSTVSWRYVESPFRKRGPSPRKPLIAGGVTIAASVVIGLAAMTGFPDRLPASAVRVAKVADEKWPEVTGCFYAEGPNPKSFMARCLGETPREILLWGDSHALQYAAPLERQLGDKVLIAGRGGCAPMDLVPIRSGRQPDKDCAAFNDEMLRAVVSRPDVRIVILSGRWARFTIPLSDDEAQAFVGLPSSSRSAELISSLGRVINQLKAAGKQVVVIGIEPEFRERLPVCISRAIWLRRSTDMCSFRVESLPGSELDRGLQAMTSKAGAMLFRPSEVFCSSRGCTRVFEGLPVTRDTDHFRNEAAAYVSTRLVEAMIAWGFIAPASDAVPVQSAK